MPQRIQLKRVKGWRMPPNTVKVDRATRWGNPFKIGTKSANGTVIHDAKQAFRLYVEFARRNRKLAIAARQELRGKNLACWCKPGNPCHADVLLVLANTPVPGVRQRLQSPFAQH